MEFILLEKMDCPFATVANRYGPSTRHAQRIGARRREWELFGSQRRLTRAVRKRNNIGTRYYICMIGMTAAEPKTFKKMRKWMIQSISQKA